MQKWRTWQMEESLEGRSHRFPIHSRLRYRLANELQWRAGTIENISSSGLMFRVQGLDGLTDRDTPLEVKFTVPREIGGVGKVQVVSRAFTKRFLPADETYASPAVAVSMSDYILPLEQAD